MTAAMRAQLVVSEAGISSLSTAGIGPGWIAAWIRAAGAAQVDVHLLARETWKQKADWRVFFARESELMRVALYHGRRIRPQADGRRGLLGADAFALDNPQRCGWCYTAEGNSRVLLLPLGDIVYRREEWIFQLNGSGSMQPLYIYADEEGELPLEPGLSADPKPRVGMESCLLNARGELPEETLVDRLESRGFRVRFAESCTAGGMSERLSRMPGASRVLDCGWTVYSNEAKRRLLGVPGRLLRKFGAVSREVVESMAAAGRDERHACVAVSGIAGPGGGDDERPVGTVWIATALPDGGLSTRLCRFHGSRAEIRRRSVNQAFTMLAQSL